LPALRILAHVDRQYKNLLASDAKIDCVRKLGQEAASDLAAHTLKLERVLADSVYQQAQVCRECLAETGLTLLIP